MPLYVPVRHAQKLHHTTLYWSSYRILCKGACKSGIIRCSFLSVSACTITPLIVLLITLNQNRTYEKGWHTSQHFGPQNVPFFSLLWCACQSQYVQKSSKSLWWVSNESNDRRYHHKNSGRHAHTSSSSRYHDKWVLIYVLYNACINSTSTHPVHHDIMISDIYNTSFIMHV